MNRTLRGRIVEKYGSMRAFAEAIGWHEAKVQRIVNGQEPTASEIVLMANTLGVDIPEEVSVLFLQGCPQNVD